MEFIKMMAGYLFTNVRYIATIIILILLLSLSNAKSFILTEQHRAWSYWDNRDDSSIKVIDHSKWQQVLNMYLFVQQDTTLFNYDAIIADNNQHLVQEYIEKLAQENPIKLNSYEQLAYWINLYNALIVNTILSKYPVDSILDIKPHLSFSNWGTLFSFFRYGPWNNKLVIINDIELSLNDITHRILFPIWGDRRVQYCLCSGSIGSPDLYPVVFTAIDMPKLLNSVANRFIQQEKTMQWIDGKLVLSRLLKNSNYFSDKNDLLSHLRKYTNLSNKSKIDKFHGSISYQFDWRLNKLSNK
jgi:hypothetical protein